MKCPPRALWQPLRYQMSVKTKYCFRFWRKGQHSGFGKIDLNFCIHQAFTGNSAFERYIARPVAFNRCGSVMGTATVQVMVHRFATFALATATLLLLAAPARAQDSQPQQSPSPPDAETVPATDSIPVLFPLPSTDRLWISGQVNIVCFTVFRHE